MARSAHARAGGEGRRRGRGDDGEGESYYVSMSDLMAGVLFLFIILLTNFAIQLSAAPQKAAPSKPAPARKTVAKAAPGPSQTLDMKTVAPPKIASTAPPWATPGAAAPAPLDPRTRALTALADYLHARGVSAEVDLGAGSLHFSNDSLFDGGGAGLSAGGRRAVTLLAQAMREVLPCYATSAALPPAVDCPKVDKRIGAVFVEGHAAGRPDAWSLSVQQASNVFSALIAAEPRLPTLQSNGAGGQSLLSVSGYGPSRPVGADPRANNRVDVRLVMVAS